MGSWILKLLQLQLVLVLIQHADSGSIVRYLPGFEGPLSFELETGYIGVGEAEEDQMFYYFIKSERSPEEDPLLVWLTGGPGCSSFSGLVYENGPLTFKVEAYNGSIPTLVSTTYSWTKVANIIYLDQPVGTGFSYSRNPLADIPSDTGSAKRVHEFVRKWLAKHPEFFSNPFYVAGNSYSGKAVPAIVQEISNGNYICCETQINLQGYILGNPLTDGDFDGNSRIPFAHGMALISDELYERNPKEDPLLVWLTGGPGCSSFSGLVYENGPLAFKVETYNGSIPTLVSTTNSWTKVANIIYLDQPVGAGFSYSRNPLADIPSDTGMAKRVDEFVRKWLAKHPEYSSNPFYVTGNSYSGKVIPAIVQEISNGNCICCKPQINLQGYVLGNPVTDFDLDNNTRVPFAHGMALISDELYESMKISCGGKYVNVDPLNTECLKLVEEFKKSVSRIYDELVLESNCDITSPDCYVSFLTYRYLLSEYWANNESVRRALKVVEGTTKKWERCNYNVQCNQDIKSSIPYHLNNSMEGYRSLIFSGDHDMSIPFVSTRAWIKSLNYSITEKWRPWMILDKVAGYTKTYANKMTFATVKGGGHTLEYKPEESSIMFKRWISGQPL